MLNVISRFLLRKRIARMSLRPYTKCGHVNRIELERYQVVAFNRVWKDARENVPFYEEWQRKYKLPNTIESLSELVHWPILTKSDLQQTERFMRRNAEVPSGVFMTGGSTGEPLRIPSWGDDGNTDVSQGIGRARYGIMPGDRTFLLWGHRHLYGKGVSRIKNILLRTVKDWLLNMKRVSAYDLSAEAMHAAYVEMKLFQPKFVIGFSPAVLAFVRQNQANAGVIKSVKVVLCTAGPLTADEKREIAAFFNARVCMEYGSVEGSVMAYTRPEDDRYSFFWDTHLIQTKRDGEGEARCLVTRFADLYVPIIRYDIGDYLDVDASKDEENSRSVVEANIIKGRPSEIVRFENGVSFYGALVGDCVKQIPSVLSSQLHIDEKNNRLEIWVTAKRNVTDEEKSLILNRLHLTVEKSLSLEAMVVQKDRLFMTVGGKTPRLVRMP